MNMWRHPATLVLMLIAVVVGVVLALLFTPTLDYFRFKLSGLSGPAYIDQSLGPPIVLSVGVEVDGIFYGGDDTVYVKSGIALVPAFRVTTIDPSNVNEMQFTLDGEPIPNDKPLVLDARRKPYELKATGRSAKEKARFSATCIIVVSEDGPPQPRSD